MAKPYTVIKKEWILAFAGMATGLCFRAFVSSWFVLLFFLTTVNAAEPPSPSAKPYVLSYVGDMDTYKAKYEDTLIKIARDHDLGFNELRAANPGIDPWLPGKNAKLVLPARHIFPDAPREGIVINLPEMRLYYFDDSLGLPLTYPLGVGRSGLSTPSGQTTVIRKTEGPTWRPTARMRKENPDLPRSIAPGTENPLGTHALYLGWPQYALHGTNRPYGIGRRVSSGCIRLYPEDIITFFEKVPVGTKVRVVDQAIKLAWIDDGLYMEVHPTLDQAAKVEQEGRVQSYTLSKDEMRAIITAAGDEYEALDWALIRRLVRTRNGFPVKIAEKRVSIEVKKDTDSIE